MADSDVIQISGHDGGTGASPLSSIKHAGAPWELGLSEVHSTLVENDLRDRVTLRVDGGLKTGWDVVLAALMGGEEFGFGTIALIAEGCFMARICHTNNCPVGVTSQKLELRKKFPGTPDNVVTYFEFVAEEVRQVMARLGYTKLTDIMGRSDLLVNREGVDPEKTKKEFDIINTDRSTGARVAGTIAKTWGNAGFAAEGGDLHLVFKGSAGQSFGVFTLPGMTMEVV